MFQAFDTFFKISKVRPGIPIVGPKTRQLYITQIHKLFCRVFTPLNKEAAMTPGMSWCMQYRDRDITQIKNMTLVKPLYFTTCRIVKSRFDILPECIVSRARRRAINLHQAFNTFKTLRVHAVSMPGHLSEQMGTRDVIFMDMTMDHHIYARQYFFSRNDTKRRIDDRCLPASGYG